MSVIYTPGEPAGIGLDLVLIHAQRNLCSDLVVFTDPDLLKTRAKELNLPIKLTDSPETQNLKELCVYPITAKKPVQAGIPEVKNAEFILQTLNQAAQSCQQSNHALFTGPIQKSTINQAGYNFSGHTEYLAQISGTEKTVMMLATKGLNVALASTHLPLSDVSKSINAESLEKTIQIIHHHFVSQKVKNPRILICGLNPHAGEGGYLGTEEIEIINPLIHKLQAQGLNLVGSVPADTAFTPKNMDEVDVVLCMYHDQGLPVLKTLGFNRAINITLGLPFIRTSVDHGTALDLAGTGDISLGSFEFALEKTRALQHA